VQRGQRASSYLVFFQPAGAGSDGMRHLQGEIIFQHRVLGIICTDQGLDRSDAPLGIATANHAALAFAYDWLAGKPQAAPASTSLRP
jgi:hypothetical protein